MLLCLKFSHNLRQNYNALSYDDKILDGFYDVYGVISDSTSEKMPSLIDLQETLVSDNVQWEAVLVNRAVDANLRKIEKKAQEMALKMRAECVDSLGNHLVQKLAILVSESMGGPVGDPEKLLRAWRHLSHSLKSAIGSMVLPLGSLTIGLARHRALLFKVFLSLFASQFTVKIFHVTTLNLSPLAIDHYF